MTDPARSTVRAGSGCVMSYRTSRARALPPAQWLSIEEARSHRQQLPQAGTPEMAVPGARSLSDARTYASRVKRAPLVIGQTSLMPPDWIGPTT